MGYKRNQSDLQLASVSNIFRVIYSPLRAFEEIAKVPSVSGPLLILFMTLMASASAHYLSSSRTFLETQKASDIYMPLTATDIFKQQLISTIGDTIFIFFLKWLIYGSAFLFILKLFRVKEGPWHQLFIAIGHLLIVAAIFTLAKGIIFYMLPTVKLKFDVWNGALQGNQEMIDEMIMEYEKVWSLIYQLRPYLLTIITTWTAFLGAMAIHCLREVPWNKALIISTIVSVISLLLLGPLAF
jgi:hypothetical protein